MSKKRIIAIAFSLVFIILLSGCNKTLTPEVVKMPDRCVYYVGETLDVTGGQIKILSGGEEQIIDMTTDMAAFFTDEGEGYAGTTFADQPFKTDGRKTVYLKYGEDYITFRVYVDSSISSYKAHCYTVLDELLNDSFCDGAAVSVLTSAKEAIAQSESFDEITIYFNEAQDFVSQYYEIRGFETARDETSASVKDALNKFDFSQFSSDQKIDIEAKIEKLYSDIDIATTKEQVETLYSAFQSEISAILFDKANAYILSLEARFKEEYAKREIYYTESNYNALTTALVEHERLIRQKSTEAEMREVGDNLFENVLPAIPDALTTLYEAASALAADGVVYPDDKEKIDTLNSDLVSFIKMVEKIEITDVTRDGVINCLDILASSEYKNLSASKELSFYAKGNILSTAETLVKRYLVLEQAYEASSDVIDAIDAIGNVRLDSGAKIEEAREAFDAWCDEYDIKSGDANRDIISNYKKLTSAEKAFKNLPKYAQSDAEDVRDLVKNIGTSEIIYSDTPRGTGEKLALAETAYNEWIETYGNFAESYINDGTDYIGQLESYRLQYNRLVTMADNINARIKMIYENLALMKYDTLDSDYKAIEESYKVLKDQYEVFFKSNGNVTDKVSEYDNVLDKMSEGRIAVYAKYYCTELEKYLNARLSQIPSDKADFIIYRSELTEYLKSAKKELTEFYDNDLSFDRNRKKLADRYSECEDEINEIYSSYTFTAAKITAKNTITELGQKYTGSNSDTILMAMADAISSIDALEKGDGYQAKIDKIVSKFKTDISTK